MKVVVAIDSFKESMTSLEAGYFVKEGIKSVYSLYQKTNISIIVYFTFIFLKRFNVDYIDIVQKVSIIWNEIKYSWY